MKLSIIIVSWKVKDLLRNCLRSLEEEQTAVDFETWVVDNNSGDGTVEMVRKEFPKVKLIASKDNNGFARGNNIALERVGSEYVLLLNPDTEVLPGALANMLKFMDEHPQAGAVGPKLLNPDQTLQPSCKAFPTISTLIFNSLLLDVIFPKSKIFNRYEMSRWSHDEVREVDQPMGAALMVRKSVIDKIGFMDERFYMFFDEVDWCYRIKKEDYKIFFTPEPQIIHHGGQSIKSAEMRMSYHWHRSLKYFFLKHYGIQEWVTGLLIGAMFGVKIGLGILVIMIVWWIGRSVFFGPLNPPEGGL
ncbi:glycosyltransferase family 2 protein [Candidatus Margulisiibacteriota bacterium]